MLEVSPSPSPRQAVGFFIKLEEVTVERNKVLLERAETRSKLRAAATSAASGGLLEPGTKEQLRKRAGGRKKQDKRRTGKGAGFSSNRREPGAPTLRRDPTGQEKMHMLQAIERAMKAENITKIEQLSYEARRAWEDPLTK